MKLRISERQFRSSGEPVGQLVPYSHVLGYVPHLGVVPGLANACVVFQDE